jgi:hypothetical protein
MDVNREDDDVSGLNEGFRLKSEMRAFRYHSRTSFANPKKAKNTKAHKNLKKRDIWRATPCDPFALHWTVLICNTWEKCAWVSAHPFHGLTGLALTAMI